MFEASSEGCLCIDVEEPQSHFNSFKMCLTKLTQQQLLAWQQNLRVQWQDYTEPDDQLKVRDGS